MENLDGAGDGFVTRKWEEEISLIFPFADEGEQTNLSHCNLSQNLHILSSRRWEGSWTESGRTSPQNFRGDTHPARITSCDQLKDLL